MLHKNIKKHITQLQQKKYRREFQEYIVEGVKGVVDALNADVEVVMVVVEGSRREEDEFAHIIKLAQRDNVEIAYCGRKDIHSIKTTDTFPGVLAIIAQDETFIEDIASGPIVCMHELKDPGNVGTIIRTADWFGIQNIVLSEDCVDVYNPKVVRSTMGSIFHVNMYRTQNIVKTIQNLKENFDYVVAALDMRGKALSDLDMSDNVIYIMGNESHGVSSELESLIDIRYTIPGRGDAESLNVAVAAAILMSKFE